MRLWLFIGLLSHICVADVYMQNEFISKQSPATSWIALRDSNLTKQQYDYSCGSASLSTILTYYYQYNISEKDILDSLLTLKGIDTTQKEALQDNQALRDGIGFSFADLAAFAQEKGFKATGLALDLPSLSQLKIPVIIYVNVRDMEHFSVYKGMDSQFVYLTDPSFGNIKVKLAKFQEMFYQRADLTHLGKILAILPAQSDTPINVEFFHQIPSTLTYELIKQKLR